MPCMQLVVLLHVWEKAGIEAAIAALSLSLLPISISPTNQKCLALRRCRRMLDWTDAFWREKHAFLKAVSGS